MQFDLTAFLGAIRRLFEQCQEDGEIDSPAELNKNVKKYVFKYIVKLKEEIIFYLQKMNINRSTLFPGLEGFAMSLGTFLAFPDVTTLLPEDSKYVRKRYAAKWPKK